LDRYVKALLGGVATVAPFYFVQLFTEYTYLTNSTPYFFLSSFRLAFFIISVGIASEIVGWYSDSIRLTWLAYVASLLGLYLLLYVGCDPRVCYNTGIDGLEPLRSYSFFLAEGMAILAAGYSAKNRMSRTESMLAHGAVFYSIAYYPVIYSLAGVRLIAAISPIPLLGLVAVLAFVTAFRVSEEEKTWRSGVGIPLLSLLTLLGISIGITAQYVQQVVPLVGTLLACAVCGGLAGSFNSRIMRGVGRRPLGSFVLTWMLVTVVLFSIVVIPPDAVNGTAPDLTTKSYYFLTPALVGGFNTEQDVRSIGVSANFSFQGTQPSSIQADNFLAVGISAHSPNCCVDGIDYGYRGDVFLYHNASEVFAASGWEVCDQIVACGGHTWKHLIYFESARIDSPIGSDFKVTMLWENHTLTWLYSAANETWTMASFRDPGQDNPYFNAGWLGPPYPPTFGGFPMFQFGMMSAFPIRHAGWSVAIACPSTVQDGAWTCINHADLFQGDTSYWKALWRWGENYGGESATINGGTKTITFQYSKTSVRNFQPAW